MEFSSIWYFSFWSLVSMAFSIATTYSLSCTTIDGRNTIQYLFLLSVNCCISYAFLYRPGLEVGKIGISFPVTSILTLWQSQSSSLSPIGHIIAWSWIRVPYLIAGMNALGIIITIPARPTLICSAFTCCSQVYLLSVNMFLLQLRLRHNSLMDFIVENFYWEFLFSVMTSNAPMMYLLVFPPDDWASEIQTLIQVPAVGSLSTEVVALITGFGYYCTQGTFSAGAVFPVKLYHGHFLCWILIQCLFVASFRVCNELHFLRTSQTLSFTLYSAVLPGVLWVCASVLEGLVAKSSMAAKAYEQRRMVEIVCGMFASAVAQYYIRAESQPLLLGCLFMAVAWLGNIANVQPATDFGIFQFFVSAALQCAVSLYGLHFCTFLVAVVGIALMVLRWKMESVLLRHFHRQDLSILRYHQQERAQGNHRDQDHNF